MTTSAQPPRRCAAQTRAHNSLQIQKRKITQHFDQVACSITTGVAVGRALRPGLMIADAIIKPREPIDGRAARLASRSEEEAYGH
jgi:hypothetical protein